jgi:hypothetical protein
MNAKLTPKFQTVALAAFLGLDICSRADFNPVPLTGSSFNYDLVVEHTAPGPIGRATTASMDSGTNNSQYSWYEMGYNTNSGATTTGMPAAGSSFTSAASATHQYQMAPSYAANNAILIDAANKKATWTLTLPAAYTNLSFLTSGGHNGLTNIGVVVHHQDGTTEKGSFSSPDWFNGASPAYTPNGRIDVQIFAFNSVSSGNPRLYSRDITVTNITSPVTSIDLTNQSVSGGDVGVFAVSGATTASANWVPIAVTGYTFDMIVEAGAPHPVFLGSVTTASMDTGGANTGTTWFEAGYDPFFPTSGLPTNGATITSSNQPDHHYTMPSTYVGNNAALVDSVTTTVNLTPATPASFSALSFLGAAANGAVTDSCTVQHQDGSSEGFSFTMPDWISSSPVAYYGNGRLILNSRAITNQNASPPAIRLYEPQIALANTVSPVTNIVLGFSSGPNNSRSVVFAVSGTAGSVPPIIGSSPTSVLTYEGSNELFTVTISGGTQPMTFQWQRATNGVFSNLADGGNIIGTTTTNLSISSVAVSNSADYRCVVSNIVGPVNSGVATLTVLSTLPDITSPSDTIASYGSAMASPAGEEVTHAIDNNTQKYLNFGGNTTPFSGVAGLVVTPVAGQTHVTLMRIYTANDVPARDPAAYTLEGSNDGGTTYTLITSGTLSLPDARNAAGSATDPLSQYMQQVAFSNPNSYTTYRLVFTAVKNASLANSCQIGELELLGEVINKTVSSSPSFFNVYPGGGSTARFDASVSPSDPGDTFQWLKATNGTYYPLYDNATVSGSQTSSLILTNLTFADAGNYIVVVSNSTVSLPSAPSLLNVLSTLGDVTVPGDTIAILNGSSPVAETVTNAIDNTTSKYLNWDSIDQAAPFVGPVGFTVTPSSGSSRVTGLRFYCGNDHTERDPVDFKLEGSNNGGASYTLIASNSLTLPPDRNALAVPLDPLNQPNQEVRFSNGSNYKSYRLSFTHVKSDSTSTSMQIAEVEFLGTTTATLSISSAGGGSLTISSSAPGELWSTTNLANPVWHDEGPITTSVTITPSLMEPAKFYRVQTQ